MNALLVLSALVAVVYSSPVPQVGRTQYHAQDELGGYNFGFSNEDGQYRQESKDAFGNVVGRYGYNAPDGRRIEIAYGANDLTGFTAVGANTAPLVPAPAPVAVAQAPVYSAAPVSYAAQLPIPVAAAPAAVAPAPIAYSAQVPIAAPANYGYSFTYAG